MLAALFFPMGLVVPVWAMTGLYMIQTAIFILAFRLRFTHPWLVLVSPFVSLVVMASLATLGGSALNWMP